MSPTPAWVAAMHAMRRATVPRRPNGPKRTRVCPCCGTTFLMKHYGTQRHCSVSCARTMQGRRSRGSQHYLWEGRSHRIVLAEHLGRSLDPTEIVHHQNGDHLDNRPENLTIMTRSAHAQLHGAKAARWTSIACANCGGPMTMRKREIERRLARCGQQRIFCSKACHGRFRHAESVCARCGHLNCYHRASTCLMCRRAGTQEPCQNMAAPWYERQKSRKREKKSMGAHPDG
jgi:HNH endonuclease